MWFYLHFAIVFFAAIASAFVVVVDCDVIACCDGNYIVIDVFVSRNATILPSRVHPLQQSVLVYTNYACASALPGVVVSEDVDTVLNATSIHNKQLKDKI